MAKFAGAALVSVSLLLGCAHQTTTVSFPVSGGERIAFEKIGSAFVPAENSRFAITESGLTTYREAGKNYLRWQFGFRVKQPTKLRSVVVEEVSGSQPVPIARDLAPEIAGIEWAKRSDLTRAEPDTVPWFYDPDSTLRIFRFSIEEADGKRSTLYQAALFDKKSKDALRYQMGPETQVDRSQPGESGSGGKRLSSAERLQPEYGLAGAARLTFDLSSGLPRAQSGRRECSPGLRPTSALPCYHCQGDPPRRRAAFRGRLAPDVA